MNFYVELKVLGDNACVNGLYNTTINCLFSNATVRLGETFVWTEESIRFFIRSCAFSKSHAFVEALKSNVHWNLASEFILSTKYQNALERLCFSENISIKPVKDLNGIEELLIPPEIVVTDSKMIFYIPRPMNVKGIDSDVMANDYPVPRLSHNIARVDVVPGGGHLLFSTLPRNGFINSCIDAYSTYGIGFKRTFLCTDMDLTGYMDYLNGFDSIAIVCYQTYGINKMREMLLGFYENKKETMRANIFYLEDKNTIYNINVLEESLVFHKFFV